MTTEHVHLRYNHYQETAEIVGGQLSSDAIHELLSLNFAFPKCKLHLTSEQPDCYDDLDHPWLPEPAPGMFAGLQAGHTYWVMVEEDSLEAERSAERQRKFVAARAATAAGSGVRDGAAVPVPVYTPTVWDAYIPDDDVVRQRQRSLQFAAQHAATAAVPAGAAPPSQLARPSLSSSLPPLSQPPPDQHGFAVQVVELPQLCAALNRVHAAQRMALVLDASEEHRVDTFLSYQHATLIEAKHLLLDKVKHVRTVADINESLRGDVVRSLKHGMMLVLRMSNSAVDFKTQFSHPDLFPREVFDPATFCNEAVYSRLVRPADLTQGLFVPQFAPFEVGPDQLQVIDNGFRVIVTSSFLLADYASFLNDAIDLAHCGVIVIRQANTEF